ncbi:DUF1963 domain-containing protein [Paenibacillus sp. FSL W8-0426]|uniref:DUF1963 domain-containing protein n=1 Tax=Paenibacillus sp. FSL W8-0426 TaxID=2921714 RepID=UPI0030D7B7D0
MAERIPCAREGCGNTVLPATAAKTGGICMPCKQEIEREERRRYIEANRRDVNLYEGISDPVEILSIMHTDQPRDPLIYYLPYERSKEQVYLSLSEQEQLRMADLAMEMIQDGDGDTGTEILTLLSGYHDLPLTAYLPELLEYEVYYPAILFRSASPSLRDQLLREVETDDEHRNHLLLMLAYIGDERVVRQFREWRQSPPAWRDRLHVPPEHYAMEGGWELTAEGTRRDLFIQPSYALFRVREQGNAAAFEHGGPVRMLAVNSACCPWCNGPLTTLIDLDAGHPALAGLSWKADRFAARTCVVCSCYGTVYMEIDEQGEPVWSEHNVMPYRAGEMDTDDYDGSFTAVTDQFRIAREPRHPFHGSEWAMEPSLSQIGGHPGWVQDAEYPNCPCCSARMKAVGQLDWGMVEEYGEGMYYIFACEPCGMTAVSYQQS